jgi:hypothetical protein
MTTSPDYFQTVETVLVQMIKKQLDREPQESTTTTITDEHFHKVESVFQYYVKLQEQYPSTTAPYISTPFQDFVDQTFNTRKLSGFEYQRLIQSMKQPEFRAKIETQWHQTEEEKKSKNRIIQKIQEKTENPESEEYLDIRHFLEYLSRRQHTASTQEEIEEKALHQICDFLSINPM